MDNQPINNAEVQSQPLDPTQVNAPSLYKITCPNCDGNYFKILGTKGAKGASIGIGMAFGAIGNLVASAKSEKDMAIKPVQYQCMSCKKKFEALPLKAEPDEILERPCVITFKRHSSFVGMAAAQTVWLNGVKVGTVNNKQTITFETCTKHNIVFVTDQFGVAFKGHYMFDAQSGGTEEINFKRKFF